MSIYFVSAGTMRCGWKMPARTTIRSSGTFAMPTFGARFSFEYVFVSALWPVKALKIVVRPLFARPMIPISTLIFTSYLHTSLLNNLKWHFILPFFSFLFNVNHRNSFPKLFVNNCICMKSIYMIYNMRCE
jgi:hypothetical protein